MTLGEGEGVCRCQATDADISCTDCDAIAHNDNVGGKCARGKSLRDSTKPVPDAAWRYARLAQVLTKHCLT